MLVVFLEIRVSVFFLQFLTLNIFSVTQVISHLRNVATKQYGVVFTQFEPKSADLPV